MSGTEQPYHHGSLRQELLSLAEVTLEKGGVDKLSLRQLARDAGVSHGAPAKHFVIARLYSTRLPKSVSSG
nr:hypothetical protein [Rhodococcus sp. OK302]